MIIPDATFSNLTLSPSESAKECLFIKVGDTHKPVLIKNTAGNWIINPEIRSA